MVVGRVLLAALAGWALIGPTGVAVGAVAALLHGPVSRVVGRDPAASVPGDEVLVEVLQIAARGVRSGLPAPTALDEAARTVGAEGLLIAIASHEQQEGSVCTLTGRLDAWARRSGAEAARIVAAAVGVATEAGADPAKAFDAAALTLQGQATARREADVASAQARASAMLMGLAPLLMLAVSALIDPTSLTRSFHEPLAVAAMVCGALLELAGICWMRRLVSAARPAS